MAASAAVAATAGLAAKGLREFRTFDKGIREVFTLLPGLSQQAYDDISKQARQFSKSTGADLNDVVGSLYQAISAGVPPGNVFDFLETANKAAVGGVTDLTTSVTGLSSVVNAYGSEVISSEKAADIFFATIRGGITNFEQLATAVGRVTPLAAALGVPFEHVGAALATITSQGTNTNEAVTGLRAVFTGLAKPTGDAEKILTAVANALGHPNIEQALQGAGLPAVLDAIFQATGGTVAGLTKVFGSVEAVNTVLQLASESGAAKFSAELENMNNALGGTQAAFDVLDASLDASLNRFRQARKVLFVDIGEQIAPDFKELVDFVTRDVMPVVERAVVGGFRVIAGVFRLFRRQALPGLTSAFGGAFRAIGKIFSALAELWTKVLRPAWSGIAPYVSEFLRSLTFYWETAFRNIATIIQIFTAIFTGDWSKALMLFRELTQRSLDAVLRLVRSFVKPLIDIYEHLFGRIGETIRRFRRRHLEPLLDALKRFVQTARRLFEAFAQKFQRQFDFISRVVSAFAQRFDFIFTPISRVVQSTFTHLSRFAQQIVQQFQPVVTFFRNLGKVVLDVVGHIGSFLGINLGGQARELLEPYEPFFATETLTPPPAPPAITPPPTITPPPSPSIGPITIPEDPTSDLGGPDPGGPGGPGGAGQTIQELIRVLKFREDQTALVEDFFTKLSGELQQMSSRMPGDKVAGLIEAFDLVPDLQGATLEELEKLKRDAGDVSPGIVPPGLADLIKSVKFTESQTDFVIGRLAELQKTIGDVGVGELGGVIEILAELAPASLENNPAARKLEEVEKRLKDPTTDLGKIPELLEERNRIVTDPGSQVLDPGMLGPPPNLGPPPGGGAPPAGSIFEQLASLTTSVWDQLLENAPWVPVIEAIKAAWAFLFDPGFWGRLGDVFAAAWAALLQAAPWAPVVDAIKEAWERISTRVLITLGTLRTSLMLIWASIRGDLEEAWAALAGIAAAAWERVSTRVLLTLGTLRTTLMLILGRLRAELEVLWAALGDGPRAAWAAIANEAAVWWNAIGAVVSAGAALIPTGLETVWNQVTAGAEAAWQAVSGSVETSAASIETSTARVETAAEGLVGVWDPAVADTGRAWSPTFDGLAGIVFVGATRVITDIERVRAAAGRLAGGVWDGAVSAAESAWNRIAGAAEDGAKRTVDAIDSVAQAAAQVPIPVPQFAAQVAGPVPIPAPGATASAGALAPIPAPELAAVVAESLRIPVPEVRAALKDKVPIPAPELAAAVAEAVQIPVPEARAALAAAVPIPAPQLAAVVAESVEIPVPEARAALAAAAPIPTPQFAAVVAESLRIPVPEVRAALKDKVPIPAPELAAAVAEAVQIPVPEARAALAAAVPIPAPQVATQVAGAVPIPVPEPQAALREQPPIANPDTVAALARAGLIMVAQGLPSILRPRPTADVQPEAIRATREPLGRLDRAAPAAAPLESLESDLAAVDTSLSRAVTGLEDLESDLRAADTSLSRAVVGFEDLEQAVIDTSSAFSGADLPQELFRVPAGIGDLDTLMSEGILSGFQDLGPLPVVIPAADLPAPEVAPGFDDLAPIPQPAVSFYQQSAEDAAAALFRALSPQALGEAGLEDRAATATGSLSLADLNRAARSNAELGAEIAELYRELRDPTPAPPQPAVPIPAPGATASAGTPVPIPVPQVATQVAGGVPIPLGGQSLFGGIDVPPEMESYEDLLEHIERETAAIQERLAGTDTTLAPPGIIDVLGGLPVMPGRGLAVEIPQPAITTSVQSPEAAAAALFRAASPQALGEAGLEDLAATATGQLSLADLERAARGDEALGEALAERYRLLREGQADLRTPVPAQNIPDEMRPETPLEGLLQVAGLTTAATPLGLPGQFGVRSAISGLLTAGRTRAAAAIGGGGIGAGALAAAATDPGGRRADPVALQETIKRLREERRLADLERILRQEEGVVRSAYSDTTGHRTIGVGHNIDASGRTDLLDRVLSDAEISQLLQGDIGSHEDQLRSELSRTFPDLWESASPGLQNALSQSAFQLGARGFVSGFPDALRAAVAGDADALEEALLDSKWATQTPGRVQRVADRFREAINAGIRPSLEEIDQVWPTYLPASDVSEIQGSLDQVASGTEGALSRILQAAEVDTPAARNVILGSLVTGDGAMVPGVVGGLGALNTDWNSVLSHLVTTGGLYGGQSRDALLSSLVNGDDAMVPGLVSGVGYLSDEWAGALGTMAPTAGTAGTDSTESLLNAIINGDGAMVPGVTSALELLETEWDGSMGIITAVADAAAAGAEASATRAIRAAERAASAAAKAEGSAASIPTPPGRGSSGTTGGGSGGRGTDSRVVTINAAARGGITTGPTLSLVGEDGPEAIVPLNNLEERLAAAFAAAMAEQPRAAQGSDRPLEVKLVVDGRVLARQLVRVLDEGGLR